MFFLRALVLAAALALLALAGIGCDAREDVTTAVVCGGVGVLFVAIVRELARSR